MSEKIHAWEAAYRRRPSGENTPHQDAEFLHDFFKKHKIRRVVDLGCGDGRHLVFFARRGYNVTGIDYAPTALTRARVWLTRENLYADLFCADMRAISCKDSAFDAVICIAVINHSRIQGIRTAIQEIHRLMRPGAWLFIVMATEELMPTPDDERYMMIEHRTYMPKYGHEKGVPHYFFSGAELRLEFSQFVMHHMHVDQRRRSCVLMQKPMK